MKNMYCRFCAELKPIELVVNLDFDENKCKEIFVKLSFLNAIYVVTNCSNLPKTVCLDCYESLNKAYEFLEKVRKAQDVLSNLFPQKEAKLDDYDLSDEDRGTLDDFFNGNDAETREVKDAAELSPECRVKVKIEPKEETIDDTPKLFDHHTEYNPNESLNVQDILDVALNKGTFNPEVQLYAKEVTNVPNKVKLWKDYPWICLYCNIEFSDMHTLRAHSKATHNKCTAYSCIDCKEFKTNDFNLFILHVKAHQKNLRNLCHYCDASFDAVTLSTHLKQHQSSYSCPSCEEAFLDETSLHKHFEEYASKHKRKPRRKAGTPITEKDRTCHICNKVYKNLNSLRDHIKRHKTDRKRNYTCDRCGKTFFNKGTLTCHVMSHDKVRPHVCRICNKSFMFPNMLRRHVEMHSGVKPFSCEVCGRCFRLQYQLNAHKIVHTDSLPHVCQYCNKAFRFKQILKNHERQHTGAKPYSCTQCFLEFSNWSNYNKHMKRRHNTDTSKKKITPAGVFPINPETGQIMQLDVQDMEEWKSKVMVPAKRGKKKAIKVENT